jgi:putative membrane protein
MEILMSYRTLIAISSMAAVGLLLVQAGRAADSSALSSQDRKFMLDAAKGGMMEVHMGHLGLRDSSSPGVKALSQRLIDDHTKGNQELMGLAQRKGVSLPSETPSELPTSLTSKTGDAFDHEFARMAVDDHQKDIAEFEHEANSGSDPDVRAWASKTLAVLRAHLDAAKALPSH